MMTRKTLLGLSGAFLLCVVSMCHAETVTATLIGLDPLAGANFTINGIAKSGNGVGQLIWDGSGFGNLPNFDGTFTTFCMDLDNSVSFSNTYTFLIDPILSTAPASPGNTPMGGLKALVMQFLFGDFYSTLTSTDALQAFQVSIWSIVYNLPGETSVTNTSDNFYVTSGLDSTVLALANNYLATAWALSGTFDGGVTALLAQGGGQDQVISTPLGDAFPIPAAAKGGSVLIAGLGIYRLLRRFSHRSELN